MSGNDSSSKIPSSHKSGATGGAATGLGVEYQTRYAVHLALDLISRMLRETPLRRPILVIEPRVIGTDKQTRWDIQVDVDGIAYEAKAKPAKSDLVDFLKRARHAIEDGSKLKFELVYGECGLPLMRAVKALVRIAKGTGADESRFRQLCGIEANGPINEVLQVLDASAFAVASRLRLKPFPLDAIDDAIAFQLRYLVPTNQADILSAALTKRFLKGMKTRECFFIAALMKELQSDGVSFVDPGAIIPGDMGSSLHRVIFFLQHCTEPVPTEVLAAVSESESDAELRSILDSTSAVLERENEGWIAHPLPSRIAHNDAGAILERGLRATLEFIRENAQSSLGYRQVENAISLVRACKTENPEAATVAFGPLDKLLKRRGRKGDVLEIANITIECARVVTRSEEVTKAEAKALICGRSWVHQRIGELEQARMFANESLALGQSIGWIRNTAFCLKCMGRLSRICAEQATHARSRSKFLNESRDFLKRAIEQFTACPDHGPMHPEVGDCQSLLGRTELYSGRPKDAGACAEIGRNLIIDHGSKDYMDLVILEGELATAQFDYSAAERKFDEALELLDPLHYEKSEIAARAFFARGLNRWKWTRVKEKACSDIRRALRIWCDSNEYFYASLAEWQILQITDALSKQIRVRLKKETPPVRVEAVRLLRTRTQKHSSKTLSQRIEVNENTWKAIIADARKNIAIKYTRW